MRFATSLGRRLAGLVVRGASLGVILGAAFPEADATAQCDCDDYGSGKFRCPNGNASSCSTGTETCDVTCT
jgi:hypothetical protein